MDWARLQLELDDCRVMRSVELLQFGSHAMQQCDIFEYVGALRYESRGGLVAAVAHQCGFQSLGYIIVLTLESDCLLRSFSESWAEFLRLFHAVGFLRAVFVKPFSESEGIATGYITRRFGPRRVSFVGSAIASLSIAACFFADDVTKLTLFCIMHGELTHNPVETSN